ncbi:MAG: hypothetical protein WDN23_19680 [Edaphobacter sp.]
MRTQSANSPSRKALKPAALALFSVSALFFTGCATQPFTDTTAHSLNIKGAAFGGQPPVTGASITLYATGQSGYGSTGTVLGTATTDSTGSFNITNAIGCGDPQQVYLVASGGNPGISPSTNNSAIVLVAALGNCSSVSSSTFININEVTTIAAAYALSGFANGVNIGTSSTNPLGLQHAFLNAANIVDYPTGTARTTTPAGNGTVPASLINSLADILEPCVNSASPGSTPCTTLFTNATPPSVTGISAPTNIWQAALDMAQYPGNNTATLYGLILGTPSFQPTLGSTAPNDLSVGVLYTAGLETDGATTATFPFGIAADANDNIWVTGMTAAGLAELSSNGTLESPAAGGYGNATLKAAFTHQVAPDLHGNIITVDSASTPNVYIFNPATTATTVIQPGGLALSGVAIDSSNNLWFSSRSSATSGQAFGQLAYNPGTGTFATTPTTFSVSSALPGTGAYTLTVDAITNNVWAPNQTAGATNYFLPPYNVAPPSLTTGDTTNYAVAIDKNGNAWIAGTGSGANGSHLFMSPHGTPSVLQATYQPTVTAGTGTVCGPLHGCGLYNPRSLMVDGNNHIFISSFSAGMIVEFDPSIGTTGGNPGTFYLTAEGNGFNPANNQTNSINPVASSTPSGLISTSAPRTLAIDAAGALWTVNATSTGSPAPVVQILGVAAPTVPVLAKGNYGVRP